MSKTTKKQLVINHFLKHPLATPRVVSEKYGMAMPAVYSLRKQAMKEYQERNAVNVMREQGVQMNQETATHTQQPVVDITDDFDDLGKPTINQLVFDHPLYPVLLDAIKQAMFGKGERHGGNVTPFTKQPWAHYAKLHGRGFLTGQATKKLEEAASTRTGEAFEQEMLGAIVYCGMAILKERGVV